ncbi:sialate O-acetylesterase [bacterium]|nr:sialate O-acetylesterase [bacterium]
MKAIRFRALFLLAVAPFFVCRAGDADVQLPRLFSDNMVIQQGMKSPVWGKADPGEKVIVTFAGLQTTATTDENGRWMAKLGPFKAGGPFQLTIAGNNTLAIKNVLVGEVWVCSGQSNMQWTVRQSANADGEIGQANFPKIRLFTVRRTVADTPQDDVVGSWVECSPRTVPGFSAVAYFFGWEIHKELGGIPIGLIHTSWGGTPSEAWTSMPALEAEEDIKPFIEYWKEEVVKSEARMAEYEKKMMEWKEASEKAKAQGEEPPGQPQKPWDQRTSPHRPASLYNAMIAPVVPYALRGAIWYQGESNASRAYQYRKLFPMMIRDWRRAWGQGDFPFLFVQLANFRNGWTDPKSWAELREAQLMTLSLPKTGMAVAIDIGESFNIHPRNKQEVGRRLALAGRSIAYDEELVYSGPIYDSMTTEGDKVRLRFKHVGSGLLAKGGPLKGFVIAGENRRFVFADAELDGDTVVVHSDYVKHPTAVRYAWWDDPQGCNLHNRESLPASPFRTDHLPGVTANVRTPKDPQAELALCEVPEDPSLPRALLIGDSISIGYTTPTRELLQGKVNLQRIPWNGGDTDRGLERLDEALGDLKWDVIHFNFGLHDLLYSNDKYQVPIEEYEKNLRELVKRLKATGAKVIWASTTPVPEGAGGRRPGDAAEYNAVAKKIMEENEIPINDLHGFALPRLKELQQPRNVHFSDKGSRALAERVAASILAALGQSAP